MVVWPASAPTPNRSNSNFVVSSPLEVGMKPLKPRRDWRMLKMVSPSAPQPGSVPVEAVHRDSGRTQRGFPIGIDAVEVLNEVGLDEPVDFHAWLVLGLVLGLCASQSAEDRHEHGACRQNSNTFACRYSLDVSFHSVDWSRRRCPGDIHSSEPNRFRPSSLTIWVMAWAERMLLPGSFTRGEKPTIAILPGTIATMPPPTPVFAGRPVV